MNNFNTLSKTEELGVLPLFYKWVALTSRPHLNRMIARARPLPINLYRDGRPA